MKLSFQSEVFLCHLFKQGEKNSVIEARFNVAPTTRKDILRRHGIKPRKWGRPLSGKAPKRIRKKCQGCLDQYPKAWCLIQGRWQHCNSWVYFNCTGPNAKKPPYELRKK